jgi:diguanylate cyclase (GGDEF)-like protein
LRSRLAAASELSAGLDRALASAASDGRLVAVIVLGVNGFRHVNAAFGREAGDAMLASLGERLLRARRQGDLVGRWQGDEFVVVCSHVDSALGARRAVERVIDDFDAPITAAGVQHRLQATFGLALNISGEAETSGQLLLERAGRAMWRAKELGLRWAIFTPQRDDYQVPRWNTAADDLRALDDEAEEGSPPPASPRSTAPT